MPQARSKVNGEQLLCALLLMLGLAYLALYAWADFGGFARLATADMYEDTLAARLMWEEKTLFPRSFLFGNQFYVIATPVFAALFYGLTGSMNTAMALATALMTLLLLLSLDWMLRPWAKTPLLRLSLLLAAVGLLFGPSTIRREDGAQLFTVMCSFYACYAVTFFVLLGDYTRSLDSPAPRLPALLLSLFLCFATGMQSLRQTCVSILPLLCVEGFFLLRRLQRREKPLSPSLLRVAAYTAANLAGVGLIRVLPVRRHTIYTGASLLTGASLSDKLREIHSALSTVTGYDYTRAGIEGRLFFCLLFAFCLVLVLAAFRLLVWRRRPEDRALAVCWWLCVIACLGVIAASLLTSVSLRAIYLFPWYFLPPLSLLLLLRRSRPRMRLCLTVLLLCFAGVNLFFSYRADVETLRDRQPTPAEELCAYAVENGFELVYGSHSGTAPYIAVHSDGALLAGCWEDEVIFKVSPHINIRDIYSLSDHERAIFVFQEHELEAARVETEANGTTLTFLGRFGEFYACRASKQLLYPITETIDWKPEYN